MSKQESDNRNKFIIKNIINELFPENRKTEKLRKAIFDAQPYIEKGAILFKKDVKVKKEAGVVSEIVYRDKNKNEISLIALTKDNKLIKIFSTCNTAPRNSIFDLMASGVFLKEKIGFSALSVTDVTQKNETVLKKQCLYKMDGETTYFLAKDVLEKVQIFKNEFIIEDDILFTPFCIHKNKVYELYEYELSIHLKEKPQQYRMQANFLQKVSSQNITPELLERVCNVFYEIRPKDNKTFANILTNYISFIFNSKTFKSGVLKHLTVLIKTMSI